MKYLLDTQVLLWIFGNFDLLSSTSVPIITNPENSLLVSKVSFWEASIKVSIGKLHLPFSLGQLVDETLANNIAILDIDLSHILYQSELPLHHRDPFDRLIISQSSQENLPGISSDDTFSLYDIQRIW
jgi:PIN domain nuclease of toxin-antitoxin system